MAIISFAYDDSAACDEHNAACEKLFAQQPKLNDQDL